MNRWSEARRQTVGFTLFELLIAMLIFVTAVATLVAAQDGCMTLAESARNMTSAVNGARLMTEQVRSTPFANVAALNNQTFTLPGWLVEHKGNVRVITTDPTLLSVYVSVTWRQKNGRVYGEDRNLNGVLDAGEDQNGNGRLDSPASFATLRADM